jgi:hypothetical protein
MRVSIVVSPALLKIVMSSGRLAHYTALLVYAHEQHAAHDSFHDLEY